MPDHKVLTAELRGVAIVGPLTDHPPRFAIRRAGGHIVRPFARGPTTPEFMVPLARRSGKSHEERQTCDPLWLHILAPLASHDGDLVTASVDLASTRSSPPASVAGHHPSAAGPSALLMADGSLPPGRGHESLPLHRIRRHGTPGGLPSEEEQPPSQSVHSSHNTPCRVVTPDNVPLAQ